MNRLEAPNPRVYRNTERVARVAAFLTGGLRSSGIHNLPSREPYIIAANHASPLDPPVLGSAVRWATGAQVQFYANKEIWERRIKLADDEKGIYVGPLNIPFGALIDACGAMKITRRKRFPPEVWERTDEIVAGNGVLGIFPQGGLRHERHISEILPGAGWVASRYGIKIIPAGLAGTDIKGIPDEPRDWRRFHVHFGEPLTVEQSDNEREQLHIARASTPELLEAMQTSLDEARARRG